MSAFHKFFLSKPQEVLNVFLEIADLNLIQWSIPENKERIDCLYNFENPKASFITTQLLYQLRSMGKVAHSVESFMTSKIISNPKIFQPSQLNCEVMEHIDLNLTLNDYHQPYPTMVIELPDKYINNRIVTNPHAGIMEYGRIIPPTHCPLITAIHFDETQKLMVCIVYYSSGQAINRFFWQDAGGRYLIEDHLKHSFGMELYEDSLTMSQEEEITAINAMRLGINACLMLMEYGCKSKGYQNENYVRKLKKYIEKDKKEKNYDKLKKDKTELRTLPVYYEFEQNIQLYQTDSQSESVKTSFHTGGEHNSPGIHWRKGHWANQPYGPKQSLRKRILRKPVLVNPHLAKNNRIITIYKE